jgi:hypothetical protein
MDNELEETKESNHPEKDKLIPSFKNDPVTNQEKSRQKLDVENLNIEAMFWKDKYYSIVPILQSNTFDLEVGNFQLKFRNKILIVEYDEKIAKLKRKLAKTEGSISINSLELILFSNQTFKIPLPNAQGLI